MATQTLVMLATMLTLALAGLYQSRRVLTRLGIPNIYIIPPLPMLCIQILSVGASVWAIVMWPVWGYITITSQLLSLGFTTWLYRQVPSN